MGRACCRTSHVAPCQRRDRLSNNFGEDGRGGCSAVTMPNGLARHDRAVLDVAVDRSAAERAGPEVLDCELGGFLGSFAGLEAVAAFPPGSEEPLDALR